MNRYCYFLIILFAVSCNKDNYSDNNCKISEIIHLDKSYSVKFIHDNSNNEIKVYEYSDSLQTLEHIFKNIFNKENKLIKIERYNESSFILDSVVIEYISQIKTIAKKYINVRSNSGYYMRLDKSIEYFYNLKGELTSDTTYDYQIYEHNAVKTTKYIFDEIGNCKQMTKYYKSYPDNVWNQENSINLIYYNIKNSNKISNPGPTIMSDFEETNIDPFFSNANLIKQITIINNNDLPQVHEYTYNMKGKYPQKIIIDGVQLIQINYNCN